MPWWLSVIALASVAAAGCSRGGFDDETAPFVSAVRANSPSGIYTTGETVSFSVELSEKVRVRADPSLLIEVGPTARLASYAGFDGARTLTFQYVVQHNDTTPAIDVAGPRALSISPPIVDPAGNVADLTLPVGALAAYALQLDGAAPLVVIEEASLGPNPSRDTTARAARFSGEDVARVKATIVNTEDCSGVDWAAIAEHPVSDSITLVPFANSTNAVCAIGGSVDGAFQKIPTRYAFLVDTLPPTVTSAVLNNGAATMVNSTAQFTLAADDGTGSGVTEMNIVEAETDPDNWRPFVTDTNVTVSAISGTKTVLAQVRDAVGNVGTRVMSNAVFLDYGTAPVLLAETPDGTTHFNPGDTVLISWSCTSERPLDPTPIPRISYTTDDGATFTTIATNVTQAVGSINWTLPASVTASFRIAITCRTIGGLDFTQLSQVANTPTNGNWRIWLGDTRFQGSASLPVGLPSALITNPQGFFVSAANDVFIARDSEILRVDARTNLTSSYIGNNVSGAGCAMADGPASASIALNHPAILGGTPDGKSFFVIGSLDTAPCQQVFRVDVTTNTLERVANLVVPSYIALSFGNYVSPALDLFYWNALGEIYAVSLRKDGGTVKTASRIAGLSNNCSTTLPAVGTAVNGVALKCNNTTSPTAAYGPLFTNGAGDELYVFPRFGTHPYRLDRDGAGVWRVAVADTGIALSPPEGAAYACIAARFTAAGTPRVICSSEFVTTPVLHVVDPESGAEVMKHAPPAGAFTNGVQITLASSSTNIYALTNFGELLTAPIVSDESAEWAWQNIGPQITGGVGNGSYASIEEARQHVGFDTVFDIQHGPNTDQTQVMVREATRSNRRITLGATIHVDTAFTQFQAPVVPSTSFGTSSTVLAGDCNYPFFYRLPTTTWALDTSPFIPTSVLFGNGAGDCYASTKSGAYPSTTAAGGALGGVFFISVVKGMDVSADGHVYFGGSQSGNSPRVFDLNIAANTLRSIAGSGTAPGFGGDNGPPNSAVLTRVDQVVATSNSQMLLFDGTRMRQLDLSGGNPSSITTVVDFSTNGGYTDGGVWDDVVWNSPCLYWSRGTSVRKTCNPSGTSAITTYDLTGTQLQTTVRLAIVSDGLLISEPAHRRIIVVDP